MFSLTQIIDFTWLAKNQQRVAKERRMIKNSPLVKLSKHKQWPAQGPSQEPDQEDPAKDRETFDYLQDIGLVFYNLFSEKTHS